LAQTADARELTIIPKNGNKILLTVQIGAAW